ncbi:TonB C-terminal domain-containing protein [Campylobacter sp. 50012-21]|uniref:TonB C-terminal domain-containing protein n=1 Tax=Campylobacter magnus TaxID=3026462 RepID=UPI00235EAE53|nr:TonB C-terminal domain-containing protein [Campylobacter magnus]MDD0846145.1 TonB C-terminal domain-containing protein [Campylobacter magnus]
MKQRKIGENFPTFNAFIISLALYIALLGFIVHKAGTATQIAEKYTDTPDAFMDVMIVTEERADVVTAPKVEKPEPKPIEPEPPKPEPDKIEPVEEQITTNKAVETPKESEPQPAPPEPEPVDMGALFNDIKVPPKPPAKPKATQSNKKSAKENKSAEQKAMDAINALQTSDKVAAPKAGLTGTFDEFKGAITRIIAQRWQKYLASSNDSVEVEMTFSADGKLLRYNFISRSYDPEFQSKARDLLEGLKSVKFPATPSGERESFKIKLSDQIEFEME